MFEERSTIGGPNSKKERRGEKKVCRRVGHVARMASALEEQAAKDRGTMAAAGGAQWGCREEGLIREKT